jgi:DNA mismatch repair protein MutS
MSEEKAGDTTPLMVQYKKIKDEHNGEVLFFRLGDFYEMFNDDAVEISRLLNLTLTHRADQPMCGIPYHAAKIYIARLLRLGKKIAICEQVGEIARGKGLTERKVIEVITPGTALETEYLDGTVNNFLASLSVYNGVVGYAYIDVTTADFFATSWPEQTMLENLSKELGKTHPKEILLPQSVRENKIVQQALHSLGSVTVSYYPDWNFERSLSYRRMVAQFHTVNLRSFSLTENSPEVGPAGFLLDYLEKTTASSIPHIDSITIYTESEFVIIDDATRRNLEILANIRDGGQQYTLLECVNHTRTAMGNRLLRMWLQSPLTDLKMIHERQNHIRQFFDNRHILSSVQTLLGSILDIERLTGRIAMERAHAKDLVALSASLSAWINIGDLISSFNFSSVSTEPAFDIIKLISASILPDPATTLTEGRIIKPGWSAELDHYRDLQDNFTQFIDEYLDEERKKTGIPNLRVRNNNNAGYFLEVSKGKIAHVPDHFIMRRSLVNTERYTTARLQELEHELNDANSHIFELEKELFIEIRSQIAEKISYLFQVSHEIGYSDVAASFAESAILHRWVLPVVDDGSEFIIQAGRHPVVELHIPDGEFVPNDSELYIQQGGGQDGDSPASFVLITGPNMAGKSTYLRQNALIAVLAQSGSFVPAVSARVGVFDRIFCRVGASDNLARGESTFLVEMTETAHILRTATKRSLVIMDEVGRGTSTEDGLAIAWAVSEYLLNTICCRTYFATHYHELTRINHPCLSLLCMDVVEDASGIVFLRKIKQGASENSYGIHVASLAGVPKDVINRAAEILIHLQNIGSDRPLLSDFKPASQTEKKSDSVCTSPALPGLFSEEELVLDAILSTDIDSVTPLDALTMLAQWKKILSGR